MICKTVHVEEGDEISLPDSLGPTDVNVINTNNLAVIVDESATKSVYVRKFQRDSGPTGSSVQIPDNAVVCEFTGNGVTYLEPKNVN
jgi:hypothetical protein